MNKQKTWIAALLALTLLYAGWSWLGGGEDEVETRRGADPSLLLDRVWIDSIPDARTDFVQVLIALGDAPIGAFQRASDYRVEAEIYTYSRKENRMKLFFPQSGKKKSFTYKIRACDDLPPFDLCLDLNKNPWGGPKRYYSFSEDSSLSPEALLGGEPRSRALDRARGD